MGRRRGVFEGADLGARICAGLGIAVFIAGTGLICLYVALVSENTSMAAFWLASLWLIIVLSRVVATTVTSELSGFIDVMKWQIAIGAAAAAVVAPIAFTADGEVRDELSGPVVLFLVSSGCAAIGYALAREASRQVAEEAARRDRLELARLIGKEVARVPQRMSVAEARGQARTRPRGTDRVKSSWWKRR